MLVLLNLWPHVAVWILIRYIRCLQRQAPNITSRSLQTLHALCTRTESPALRAMARCERNFHFDISNNTKPASAHLHRLQTSTISCPHQASSRIPPQEWRIRSSPHDTQRVSESSPSRRSSYE